MSKKSTPLPLLIKIYIVGSGLKGGRSFLAVFCGFYRLLIFGGTLGFGEMGALFSFFLALSGGAFMLNLPHYGAKMVKLLNEGAAMSSHKQYRIKKETSDVLEKMAVKMGFKPSMMLDIALLQGIETIRINGIQVPKSEESEPEIDGDVLYKKALLAAKKGTDALNNYLRGVSARNQNLIKYDIAVLRERAAAEDKKSVIAGISDVVKEGDDICLRGVSALTKWFESLSKTERVALGIHHEGWVKDASRSDKSLKLFGYRPPKRQFSLDDNAERERRNIEAAKAEAAYRESLNELP